MITFIITAEPDWTNLAIDFPDSPAIKVPIPNNIENTINCNIFDLDNSNEKSFTVNVFTICCNNPTFSVAELSLADDIISLNNDVSNPFVGFIKSTPTNPITAATKAVPKNTITILFSIFPNLCIPPPILAIADVTLKNTNGTNVMNNKFKNNSPIGFKTTAFSPIVAPTIPPSNIAPSNTIEDL